MSDGKEVKRYVMKRIVGTGVIETFTGIDESDHDRIVAELRAEVERLKHAIKQEIQNNDEFGCEFVYIVMAKQTIARQARVIEIAKRVLHNAGLRPPDGGTPTVETICEDLNDAIKEITAIERAEGK